MSTPTLAHSFTSAWRTMFYGLVAGVARNRRAPRPSAAARRALAAFWWDAFLLQRRGLADASLRQVLQKLERADLADLPWFLASVPADLWRTRHKHNGGKAPQVQAPDDFDYPGYYLHDFHNQHNGGLSPRAAATYEWQIRFLFAGTNRLMRQAVIDQLPQGDDLRVLDVGCGTAAWLPQARLQGRGHEVVGVDLSPPYLAYARKRGDLRAEFVQANAEALPDAYAGQFDKVVCIWMYHELPPAARQHVSAQMHRALKPGGEVIFMDAVQAIDVPGRDIEFLNQNFAHDFDEPYFASYQALDLQEHFAAAGLTCRHRQRSFLSCVMRLQKA